MFKYFFFTIILYIFDITFESKDWLKSKLLIKFIKTIIFDLIINKINEYDFFKGGNLQFNNINDFMNQIKKKKEMK